MRQVPQKILLIDNDPDTHHLIRLLVQRTNLNVDLISCYEAHRAMEFIHCHAFDLVLLDLCLKEPHHGSVFIMDLAQRAKEGFAVPTVMILTAETNKEVVDCICEMGGMAYFEKPLDLKKLYVAIKNQLEQPSSDFSPRLRLTAY